MAAELSYTGHALDHRETVEALTSAMQAVTTDELELAADTAAELARAGFTLVRIEETAGLTRPGMEAATGWFSRTEDI
jgi:hypothetical protein